MVEGALQAALAVLIGAVVIRWGLLARLPGDAERQGLSRKLAAAGMMAGFAAVALIPLKVWLQVAAFLEPGESWLEGFRTILLATESGKATLVQVIWASAATVGFAVARHGNVRGWRAVTFAAAIVAVTPALGGHAATASSPTVAMTAAVLHVLGAAAWLGGLFHLWHLARAMPTGSTPGCER